MIWKSRPAPRPTKNHRPPLHQLDSATVWSNRPSPASYYQYGEGQQAVELLRADIGRAGINRILELMGQGQPFQQAFATVVGKSFDEFAAAYPAPLRAIALTTPGIAPVAASPIGPALSSIY